MTLRGTRKIALLVVAVSGVLLMVSCQQAAVEPARWFSRAPMSVPRDEFGAAVVRGRIYVFGGMTGQRGNDLRSGESYDPQADDWQPVPNLPRARSALRAAAVGPRIFLLGGATKSGPTNMVESFDTERLAWTSEPPMPTPRFDLAVAAIEDEIYAVGGYAATGATNRLEAFDTTTKAWISLPPMPTARYNLAAAVLGQRLYAIGGRNNGDPLPTVEIYDPNAKVWQQGPPLPQGLSNFAAVTVQGAIHTLLHRMHFVLREGAQSWETDVPPRLSRHGLAVLAIGDQMYAVGGCTEQLRDSAATEVFASPSQIPRSGE